VVVEDVGLLADAPAPSNPESPVERSPSEALESASAGSGTAMSASGCAPNVGPLRGDASEASLSEPEKESPLEGAAGRRRGTDGRGTSDGDGAAAGSEVTSGAEASGCAGSDVGARASSAGGGDSGGRGEGGEYSDDGGVGESGEAGGDHSGGGAPPAAACGEAGDGTEEDEAEASVGAVEAEDTGDTEEAEDTDDTDGDAGDSGSGGAECGGAAGRPSSSGKVLEGDENWTADGGTSGADEGRDSENAVEPPVGRGVGDNAVVLVAGHALPNGVAHGSGVRPSARPLPPRGGTGEEGAGLATESDPVTGPSGSDRDAGGGIASLAGAAEGAAEVMGAAMSSAEGGRSAIGVGDAMCGTSTTGAVEEAVSSVGGAATGAGGPAAGCAEPATCTAARAVGGEVAGTGALASVGSEDVAGDVADGAATSWDVGAGAGDGCGGDANAAEGTSVAG